jgi:hypothetical protein
VIVVSGGVPTAKLVELEFEPAKTLPFLISASSEYEPFFRPVALGEQDPVPFVIVRAQSFFLPQSTDPLPLGFSPLDALTVAVNTTLCS